MGEKRSRYESERSEEEEEGPEIGAKADGEKQGYGLRRKVSGLQKNQGIIQFEWGIFGDVEPALLRCVAVAETATLQGIFTALRGEGFRLS